jgi:hypothetical protein
MKTRLLIVVLHLLALGEGASGRGSRPDTPGQMPQPLDQLRVATEQMKKLGDWQEQCRTVERAIDRIWLENGWNKEPDLFARRAAHRVASVPPWEVAKRIEVMTDIIRDRYRLTDDQFAALQGAFYRELGGFMFNHAGTIFRQTREAVHARLANEPFTTEQVARWTRESDGLLQDARTRFERIGTELAQTLNPAQRRIYDRDMQSYRQRTEFMDQMRRRWAEGGWRPEDWGLENDPIQSQGPDSPSSPDKLGSVNGRPQSNGKPAPAPFLSYDETTWGTYVRLFVIRYRLDAAQIVAAHSILREVEARAADHRKLHRKEMDAVPRGERDTSPVFRPIRQLFEELQRRLRTIPTSAQRRAAGD